MLEKIKKQSWSLASFLVGLIFVAVYLFKRNQYQSLLDQLVDTSTFKVLPILVIIPIVSSVLYFVAKRDDRGWIKILNYWLHPYIPGLAVFWLLGNPFPGILGFGLFAALLVPAVRAGLVSRMLNEPYRKYVDGEEKKEEEILDFKAEPGDFVIGEIYKRNLDETGNTPDGEDDYIETGKTAVLPLRDRFVHALILGVTGSGKTSQSLLPMFNQDFLAGNFVSGKIDVVQIGQIVLEPKGDFAKATWAIGKIKEKEKKDAYIEFLLGYPQKLEARILELADQREEYLLALNGKGLSRAEEKELHQLESLIADEDKFSALPVSERIAKHRRIGMLKSQKNGVPLEPSEEEHRKLVDQAIKDLLFVKKNLQNVLPLEFTYLDSLTPFALFRYASLLTDLTANPEGFPTSWPLILNQDPQQKRDLVMLFDPSAKVSLCFNPLFGPEETAVATVKETLIAFMADSSDFFKNMAATLLQNGIKAVKRVYGDDATLMHLNDVLTNNNGRGDEILKQLGMVTTTAQKASENKDIQNWFQTDYYSGLKGLKGATRTWDNSSGIRSILANLLDSKRIRSVLCPPPGVGSDLDFDTILRTGDKVALSTATGLSSSIGSMLGSFLMLQLQAAVGRRPGSEDTRVPVILYIDEFQDYANEEFEFILTQGRSYRVSATMATQTLGIVKEKAGDGLVQNLQSNARNVIVYPGASETDADYFMKRFGTVETIKVKKTIAKEVDRYKIDEIKTQLGLNNAPRESISEDTADVERFTKSQIMYGANYRTRPTGGNDAFGFIFYIIIVKNSPQPPAVAKISYIPYDLKQKSDRLVFAYDQTNRLNDKDEEEILDNESQVDPFQKEANYQEETLASLNQGLNKESDPMVLNKGLNNSDTTNPIVSAIPEDAFNTNLPDFSPVSLDELGIEEDVPTLDSPTIQSFDDMTL